jgi:hypothetical protein
MRGWNGYFDRQQTESKVKEEFSNGAHGIAIMLWPASQHSVLDGSHARAVWARTPFSREQALVGISAPSKLALNRRHKNS